MPGFKDVVKKSWEEPVEHVEPCHILFAKLKKTAYKLRLWSKSLFSNAKIQLAMALEIILRFDIALETRDLSPIERSIRSRLKRRMLGLVALERAQKKQCSRISNLKEGDANTRYFHRRVTARCRKNFIQRLKNRPGWVTSQEEKEDLVHHHFSSMLKKAPHSVQDFNWELPLCGSFGA